MGNRGNPVQNKIKGKILEQYSLMLKMISLLLIKLSLQCNCLTVVPLLQIVYLINISTVTNLTNFIYVCNCHNIKASYLYFQFFYNLSHNICRTFLKLSPLDFSYKKFFINIIQLVV